MDEDFETYVLLLLSDSNLPTGSFVASSGLESFVTHGFASSPSFNVIDFVRNSLSSYSRSALPFVSDAHRIVSDYSAEIVTVEENPDDGKAGGKLQKALGGLTALDELYDAMTLNHVTRRASKSQGVALLTLFSKGFSRPSTLPVLPDGDSEDHQKRINLLLDEYKLMVRREQVHGHLPTCWGALTAALGLSLEKARYLHLFLHARGLLSASIRLNHIGPYGAQQLLLHAIRPLVADEASRCKSLSTGLFTDADTPFDELKNGAASTWPLGEILAGRHDLQHSRIFNS